MELEFIISVVNFTKYIIRYGKDTVILFALITFSYPLLILLLQNTD